MTRRNFPDKIKAAAFEQAKGRCVKCTAKLFVGKIHYDHRIPDAMGGEPTLENCDVLCTSCHGIKTQRGDVPAIAKVKRIRAKHIGAHRPSGFKKPPPGFKHNWRTGRMEREAT